MVVTGDGSKVQRCKEQYCIGSWNFRSNSRQIGSDQTGDDKNDHLHFRNQQTKLTEIGEFNSYNHYIYFCGQEDPTSPF